MATQAGSNPPPRLTRGNLVGLVSGNVLEFYDFTLFAFFAPQIGASMFRNDAQSDGLLLALATFAVGFLTRPLGAAVIGRYADRVGRKPAMLLSFMLMGFSLLVVGLTPPASVLGVWSAVLITMARLVQGFALGGEVGPTTALLIEAAPPRRRGLYGGWQIGSQGLAVLLAGLVGLSISLALPTEEVTRWGWRLGVLLGVVILPVGLWLRKMIPETLHEEPAERDESDEPQVAGTVVAAVGLLLILSGTITAYTMQYFSTYCISILKVEPAVAFSATSVIGLSMFICGVLGGFASDRFGRPALIIWPRVVMLVLIYPIFSHILTSPTLFTLTSGVFVLTALYGLSSAPANVWVAESFPRSSRSTGYALTYTIAVSVFGGGAQFIITWLIRQTGDQMMPAWWLTGATACGVIGGMITYRLARRSLRLGRGQWKTETGLKS